MNEAASAQPSHEKPLTPRLQDLAPLVVGTLLLTGLDLSNDIPWITRSDHTLQLLSLVCGSWPGLITIGYVADAVGAATDRESRARILNDRFVGSFGVCAIGLSLLIELAAILSGALAAHIVALSLVYAALIGYIAEWLVGRHPMLQRCVAAITLATMAGTIWMLSLMSTFSLLTSVAAAVIVGKYLSGYCRHGFPVAATVAGHVALLVLLACGSLT
jgi:hypothetical protein